MPNPNLTWRFLSRVIGDISLAGCGGVVFLFLMELAILGDNGIKIQYYKSKKTYLVFEEDLFCVSLWRYFIKFIFLERFWPEKQTIPVFEVSFIALKQQMEHFISSNRPGTYTKTRGVKNVFGIFSSLFRSLLDSILKGFWPNNEYKIIRRSIASLKYFSIFNRWGNSIFETTSINNRWNGEYKGIPQFCRVYVFQTQAVSVEEKYL